MKIDITITRQTEGLTVTGRNQERVKIEIPTGWHQVTFKQYLDLKKAGKDLNQIDIIAIFTGLERELIEKAQIKNLSAVTACLAFMTKPPVYVCPTSVLGYPVVANLETESIAQFADLQEICKGFTEDEVHNMSQFPLIVATYAVSPYNFKEAEKIQDQFLFAPCTEVLAIGNFTYLRLRALSNGIVPTSPRAAITKRSVKQGLADWLKNLASSIRYATWKRSLPLSERKYLNGR
jgi:hypothetical protein